MRDRPFRTPRAPKLDWPGGIVPEWAKPQASPVKRRGKGGKGGRGGKDDAKRERLQKVMAQSGHGSRRNIEILIAQGHITINGQVAKLGDLVGPGDRVKVDGKLISLRFGALLPRVLLYHKPEGEICTRDDPEGRPTVFAKLPKMNNARWVSIGRLDFNTSGLLMFTTNGELANHLMHPRYEMEREYAVRLMGELTPEQVQLLTGDGVDVDGEKCRFVRLVDRGGEGANHWYHVVLMEGKNREVRRMFEVVGIMVSRLMRVRYGPVELPRFLKRGMMRDMPEADVVKLMDFCGMGESAPGRAEDGGEEEEEEASPGNVVTDENRVETPEDFPDEDEDELQPAHLMEGYRPLEPEIIEDDDDRQPDFERMPGFNRATGTMGLPAGHRGYVPQQGPGQGQGHGQGQKKRRGKRHAGKPPTPGQGAGQGQFQPKGQGRAAQGPGHGKKRPHGKGQGHAGKGPGQGHVQGQPRTQPQPQPQAAAPQAKLPAVGAEGGPGQGKPGRRRRGRNRNRNRSGESQPPSGGNSGGVPA